MAKVSERTQQGQGPKGAIMDATDLAHYHDHGYVIVKDVIDAESIAACKRGA